MLSSHIIYGVIGKKPHRKTAVTYFDSTHILRYFEWLTKSTADPSSRAV